MAKDFTLKDYEKDLTRKKGGRNKSSEIVSKVLLDDDYEEPWDPSRDPTYEDYLKSRQGINVKAMEFFPKNYKMKTNKKSRSVSRKSRRLPRKSVRKSRSLSRKSTIKSGRLPRKSTIKSGRLPRKSTRKSTPMSKRVSRKSTRKSRRVSRKSTRRSRESSSTLSRKSRRLSRKLSRSPRRSRKIGKKEMTCKNLLKEKIGVNIEEYKNGRYSSRNQAIAVAYSQVKKMKPLCDKYLKKK
jgi:hypothetical protein